MMKSTISRAAALLKLHKKNRPLCVILTMLLTATTAWAATVQFPIYTGDEGTESKPYQIKTIADLNKLAQDVNSGTNYLSKYFRLENDLDFTYTTAWNSKDAYTSNFTSIGNTGKLFSGHFDGGGHTISGLRINSETNGQGLIGGISSSAEVKNVTIADARITGGSYTGGVVGINGGGKVTNCHVMADVAIVASVQGFGGVVGCNNGTVSGCSSAVKIIAAEGKSPSYLGGLVGWNYSSSSDATLTDNVVIGADIPAGQRNTHAAIAVDDKNSNRYHVHYERNYYYNCRVADIANATDKGITTYNSNNSATTGDITDNDGAVRIYSLSSATGITASATATVTYNGVGYYKSGTTITLSGRPTADGFIYPYLLNGMPIVSDTFTMPASDVTVTVGEPVADWQYGAEGTAGNPYQIKTTFDLDLLGQRVNSGEDYYGKYFKLMNDIAYSHTTAWNDATSTENNYTAIGNGANYFSGTFDGQGHTISGIRIYSSDYRQGLFGYINGFVRNLILADARITGKTSVGGIAGTNRGTIENCHVTANVFIGSADSGASCHGGIAGENFGTVDGCTSSATLSQSLECGGIVGRNGGAGIIMNCLAKDVTINGTSYVGAIVGYNEGTLSHNYYSDCTINAGLTELTSNIGCSGGDVTADVTENDGAVQKDVYTLTLDEGITAKGTPAIAFNGSSYSCVEGTTVTLSYMQTGYEAHYSLDGGNTLLASNTFTMPDHDVTVSASCYPIDWATESTGDDADHAYMIYNPEQLDLLAQRVNNGTDYAGKFFKLGADIAYTHKAANEEGADTENNYTAIGHRFNSSNSYPFSGTFDGAGHTIRGIRIYKSDGSGMTDRSQGLFGYVKDGTVKDVTLTDARITGERNVGGIIGFMSGGSSNIENCHVLSNVTIHAVEDNSENHGGIAGKSDGSVSGCTSAATLTVKDGITECICYGGIVGIAASGSLHNNLAVGVTIPEVTNSGAIAGINEGDNCTFKYNYYRECSVGTTPTASGIGCNGADILAYDGAVPGYTLTLADGITAVPAPVTVSGTGYYKPGTTITLSGRPTEAGYFYPYLLNGTAISGDTFTMPASDVTVTVGERVEDWQYGAEGTAGNPFQIKTTTDLDLLALRVNGGNEYGGKYFKLMNDIAYSHNTAWNNATSTENNYTAIGNNAHHFAGTFDGDGHTISGIRIYTNGSYQGLFGEISVSGIVRNVILTDTRITGNSYVGGIMGYNDGTIENCHSTATVFIGSIYNQTKIYYGGIAGYNDGTVNGCTSSAILSRANCNGGIVGKNEIGTVKNCLAIGATINGDSPVGAIVGENGEGTLSHNYYSGCKVECHNGPIGCNGADVTADDGAVKAVILSDAESVPTDMSGKVAFRREFTGGKASTVIFPFDYEKGTEGTYYTFGGVIYDGNKGKWIATMNEYTDATLAANTPYLFMPAGTDGIVPVLFHGAVAASISAGTTTNGNWQFKGVYEEKTWAAADCGRDYGFAATSGKATDGATDVEAGDFVKLAAGAWIRPLRAYLTYTGSGNPWATTNAPAHRAGTELPQSISVVLVSANGETTDLENVQCSMFNVQCDSGWFTLDGRKLSQKPTAKGVYIVNGRKIVVK